jgi:hypothetical protein
MPERMPPTRAVGSSCCRPVAVGSSFELWEGTGKETRQVVERWESPWFPSTMEPASVLARIGHQRTNSEGSDADQARP